MDGILDEIELLINRMPDSEMKDRVRERYDSYRQRFENNPKSVVPVSDIGHEIILFYTALNSYINGNPTSNPLKDFKPIPSLAGDEKRDKDKNIIELEIMLIEILDSAISSNDIETIESTLEQVISEYKSFGTRNQELEQKIAETQYALMKGLLKSGQLDKAQTLIKQFGTDMSLFLHDALLKQVEEVRNQGRTNDAYFLYKYCTTGLPKEKSLEFWERLINVEEPSLNYKLPEKTEPVVEQQKNKSGLFVRLKARIDEKRRQKEEVEKTGIITMHIRFDPNSDFHHMNKKDFEKVLEALRLEEGKNEGKPKVRLVFDEGITQVGLPLRKRSNISFLHEVVVPSTATEIIPNGFIHAENLHRVDLSNAKSLETIGGFAFSGAVNLLEVNLSNATSLKSIGNQAFQSCCSLTRIVIPTSTESIGDYAFIDCHSLEHIVIPASTESIGDYAFADCHSLEHIDFSNARSLTSIGSGAFNDCFKLSSLDLSNTRLLSIKAFTFSPSGKNERDHLSLEELILPTSMTEIERFAFSNCSIKKIKAPKKLEETLSGNKNYQFGIYPKIPEIEVIDEDRSASSDSQNPRQNNGSLEEKAGQLREANTELRRLEGLANCIPRESKAHDTSAPPRDE
jgi:hypothetical protein